MSSLVTDANSYISFIASGDEDGFTRAWPMFYFPPVLSLAPLCFIDTRDIPVCANAFANSQCGNPNAASFPPYDVRCATWYGDVRQSQSPTEPFFALGLSIVGTFYVFTGSIAIFNETSGDRLGAVSLNFFITALEQAINSNPIIQSGYTYIVNANNVDALVVHPKQTLSCTTVQCAESMTSAEYAAFKADVLQAGPSPSITYTKGGQIWRVATQVLDFGNVHYLVVGTVPDAELIGFTVTVQDSIDEMTLAFTIAIAVVMGCIAIMVANIVRMVTKPLDDLRLIMQMALRKDFSKELSKHAASTDLAGLMLAIAQLLVALKLDSMDSSADLSSMKATFEESLNLYTTLGNKKGMGNCLSNLATIELSMGQLPAAKQNMERAIEIAKEVIASMEVSVTKHADVEMAAGDKSMELQRAKIVLSDRQGKLALILLELQDYLSAVNLLERLLEYDRSIIYIRGCIEKQSALGHHYLRSGQLTEAERIFNASLKLMQDMQHVQGVSANEASAYEMMALYDLAVLEECRDWHASEEGLRKLESKYLAALTVPAYMNENIVKRVLRNLVRLYSRLPQLAEARKLVQGMAGKHGLKLTNSATNELIVRRRVVFVIDFSSKMAGSRIRAVKDGMHSLLQDSLHDLDSLAILSFNNSVQEVLPLTVRAKNVQAMAKRIETLVAPVGGTALYDGVARAMEMLKPEVSSDVILILAEGADTKSKGTLDTVLRPLSSSLVSLMALALGQEATHKALQEMVQIVSRGFFANCGDGAKEEIANLFHAASLRLQATSFRLEEV
ncbi:VWA domain-containing protein [archaeon]|nr:MAG: VWA domain-containing protein [archaeon]